MNRSGIHLGSGSGGANAAEAASPATRDRRMAPPARGTHGVHSFKIPDQLKNLTFLNPPVIRRVCLPWTTTSSTCFKVRMRALVWWQCSACSQVPVGRRDMESVRLLPLPLEQQPQPTHTTLRKGEYVALERQSTRAGMRGQIPGALYMPSSAGQPPPGFTHVWHQPASLVRVPFDTDEANISAIHSLTSPAFPPCRRPRASSPSVSTCARRSLRMAQRPR